MSLRNEAIEAMARALPYRHSGSRFQEAEPVLDALLSFLAGHADEWSRAALTRAFGNDPTAWPLEAMSVKQYLEVLAGVTEETPK